MLAETSAERKNWQKVSRIRVVSFLPHGNTLSFAPWNTWMPCAKLPASRVWMTEKDDLYDIVGVANHIGAYGVGMNSIPTSVRQDEGSSLP